MQRVLWCAPTTPQYFKSNIVVFHILFLFLCHKKDFYHGRRKLLKGIQHSSLAHAGGQTLELICRYLSVIYLYEKDLAVFLKALDECQKYRELHAVRSRTLCFCCKHLPGCVCPTILFSSPEKPSSFRSLRSQCSVGLPVTATALMVFRSGNYTQRPAIQSKPFSWRLTCKAEYWLLTQVTKYVSHMWHAGLPSFVLDP